MRGSNIFSGNFTGGPELPVTSSPSTAPSKLFDFIEEAVDHGADGTNITSDASGNPAGVWIDHDERL